MQNMTSKKEGVDTRHIFLYSGLGWIVAAAIGIAWALGARSLSLSKLFAAQSTLGIFGFAGSMSHYFLLGKTKVTRDRRISIVLSLVWGVFFAGAVTPLFSIFGTPVKMAVFAFSSFAVFGALGGMSTAWIAKRMFDDFSCEDIVPIIVIWAFGLGLGAISVSVSAAFLKLFFPEPVGMVLAIGAMALMLGACSGFSLALCVPEKDIGSRFFKPADIYDRALSDARPEYGMLTAILIFAPFYLNDFSNIFISDWRWWLFIDYVFVRLFPFIVICRLLSNNRVSPEAMGIGPQSMLSSIIVYIVGTLAAILILQNKSFILNGIPGYQPVGVIPKIFHADWRWFDLTAGLMATGVVEELVFRAYLYSFLRRFTDRSLYIVLISATAFGLIHWSLGFHHVIAASVIGGVYMLLYIRTRSLPALVFAHYTVNFMEYSDVVDKFLFRYF
ncbi:MAG TPA: CPBP family intramembrane metalloprotease [Deltaproteobacteria bacterium]|nr:CPBP family intramembrane metalloprotease [Deltaproteobacteria bacterium]